MPGTKKHKQLKRYTVTDFIKHLYEIKKVRINEQWVQEPQLKATETLLKNLNLHIRYLIAGLGLKYIENDFH